MNSLDEIQGIKKKKVETTPKVLNNIVAHFLLQNVQVHN